MGTPLASNALDQMRNVQNRVRFGVAEYASTCANKSVRQASARTGITDVIAAGATTATRF